MNTAASYAQRRANIQTRLKERNVDLLAIGPSDDMTYLLGGHPHPDERPCLLLLTPAEETILVPSVNAEQLRKLTDLPMTLWQDEEGALAGLMKLHTKNVRQQIRVVAVDPELRADATLMLADAYPKARFVTAPAALGDIRIVKSNDELNALETSAKLADQAVEAVFRNARIGMTESELSTIALQVYQQAGAQDAFALIAIGDNSAYPHHHTGSRVLKAHTPVLIDTGARLNGYVSDITRVGYVGTPDKAYRQIHSVVNDAVAAALQAIQAGVPAREIDRAARSVITRAGYGDYFVHRTGHGIGLSVHEAPYITSTSNTRVEQGMAFTVEPGIYIPGHFGIRLEEVILVTDSGPKVTSQLSRHVFQLSEEVTEGSSG